MRHSKNYVRLMNSSRWQTLRVEQLIRQPECEQCAKEGRVTLAQCVHHITPVESGRTDQECEHLAFSPSNLMSLCYSCHSAIHKADGYQTREGHTRREADKLEAWKARRKDPGVSFLLPPSPDSQIHCCQHPLTKENSDSADFSSNCK